MKYILALLLLLPSSAFGVVAYDNSATTDNQDTNPITISGFVVAASNPLILCATVSLNQVPTDVTYNSVSMTQIGSTISQGGSTHFSLWKLTGQSGTHDAVFTFASDVTLQAAVGCSSYTGVHQVTPVGTEQTSLNFEADGGSPISITVPANGLGFNAVASILSGPGCNTLAIDSGSQTEDFNICSDAGAGASVEESGATVTASSTLSWTSGGGDYRAQIGVAINPTATVASNRRKPIVMQ